MKNEDALIVVVDDEDLIRTWLGEKLRSAGYTVETASTGAEGRRLVTTAAPALVLLDLRLPDGNGIQLLEEYRDIDRDLIVIIVTAYGEIDTAVEAVKSGAYDFVEKPVEFDSLLLTIEKALETRRLRRQVTALREQHRWRFANIDLVGRSGEMQSIVKMVEKVAGAESAAVLLTGESGTGKDLVARAIHAHSPRADQPFLEINCSALPENLVESELFGHERGAYTDARSRKRGLAELADGGTLFLDEVGELPLELQAKLLAVLERRTVRRVGSSREHLVAAWLIAASNRDLQSMVEAGTFRSDLYFRMQVLTLSLPPLRERGEDILLLVRHFASRIARRYGLAEPQFTEDALQALGGYSWPGNVRELMHLIERAILLSGGEPIDAVTLNLKPSASDPENELDASVREMTLEETEAAAIEAALKRAGGNVSEAARRLGVSRMVIRYRMQKLGIDAGRH